MSLHVDDLAEASVSALERWRPNVERLNLNVGTGIDLTIKDLAQLVSEIIEYQGNIFGFNNPMVLKEIVGCGQD